MTDKEPKGTHERAKAERPSALTMITAAAASAAAFYVITKSGIAGTLVGAAVFSAVYHGASHWLGGAAERGASWWLDRRGVEVGERSGAGEAAPDSDLMADAETAVATTVGPAAERAVGTASSKSGQSASVQVRRALAVWGPLILALAALGASGYSVVTGEPIERVIIRERVVEKPVVEERVVVQRETVTVTVTVPARRDATGNEPTTPASTTTTSTTVPPSSATTSTTAPGGGGSGSGTTTSTKPPAPTTTLPATTSTETPLGE